MGLKLEYSDGQTPLEEEEKAGLLIPSVTTQGELNQFEQLNIEKAVMWSLKSKFNAEQILYEKFIRQLHKKMFSDVWRWAGSFRKTNKNIGTEWHKIGLELKVLLDDTYYWIKNETYPPEEIALRLKHRIVLIHCFPNGNGRHSRLLADIVMESVFNLSPFSWHRSTIVKADTIRKKYIKALKSADAGDINPLIQFASK